MALYDSAKILVKHSLIAAKTMTLDQQSVVYNACDEVITALTPLLEFESPEQTQFAADYVTFGNMTTQASSLKTNIEGMELNYDVNA